MSTGHYHCGATNEEIWQVLQNLDWCLYEAGFSRTGGGREYLPIEDLQQHLLEGSVTTILLRLKTGLGWDADIVEGRYVGYMAFVLPIVTADFLNIGSLSFWDTRLDPAYSSPKPIYQHLRKHFESICIHELEGRWVTSGPVARVSDGAVELRRGGIGFKYANQILELKNKSLLG